MTMFVWRSKTFENYATGHIIVEATGAPEARRKALAEFEKYLAAYYDWADDEYLNQMRDAFRLDLEGEYQEPEVVFIRGSE